MFCLQNSNLWRNIHVNVDQRISRLLCRVVVRTSHNTSAWGYGQYSWWNVKYNVCSYNTVSFPLKLNSKHWLYTLLCSSSNESKNPNRTLLKAEDFYRTLYESRGRGSYARTWSFTEGETRGQWASTVTWV